MDTWGLIIFVASLVLYLLYGKKKGCFLFTAGIGAGLFIAAVWLVILIANLQ